MSLRTRLALSVGVLVALAIALSSIIIVRSATQEAVDEVDRFLEDRLERLSSGPLQRGGDISRGRGRDGAAVRVGRKFAEALSEDDAATQVITPDGVVRLSTSVELPVGDDDLDAASGSVERTDIRTDEVDGVRYRIISGHLEPVGAVMVGRDLSEVDSLLEGLTRRTVVLGLVGAGVAALAAWLLATRLSRPIDRVTSAAEHVADTQDLSASIEVSGSGEAARLAQSFNTMLDALDTSRRQQQRLVMDASHELRTPLTSLRTNLDVLRRADDLPDADRAEVVADLSTEVDELNGLVTELVDLATSARRPTDPVEEVDLAEVAAAVAARAERRSGRVVHVLAEDATLVMVRRAPVERAISNLVDNAIKFSDDEVEVTVRGGTVEVRDHGPGVAPEDRERIFDRFYRSVATRSAPGSGLGLSIVHDVATSHGGSAFVRDPEDGVGVVVGFELPVAGNT